MQSISVQVKPDHLERIAKASKPIRAVAELVWNSLDADATEVRIEFEHNELGGLSAINVIDNGHGLAYSDVESAFGNLGGSWKSMAAQSKSLKRNLHGKGGLGRFQAFSLGSTVTWITHYNRNKELFEYNITGKLDNIGRFDIDEPSLSSNSVFGTTVQIRDLKNNYNELVSSRAVEEMTEILALYLMKYHDISINYNGKILDVQQAIANVKNINLPKIKSQNGNDVESELTVVEWKSSVSRSLVLCDASGFALHEMSPGIQAPGFEFTAYLKSEYFRLLNNENIIELEDFDSDLAIIVEKAKDTLKKHFRARAAERAKDVVQEWVSEGIYPYSGIPHNITEKTERQVFDVLALNVSSYLPSFSKTEQSMKKLSFRLLKQAIEQNASSVLSILKNVLDLPKDKQDELAFLLEKTTLSSIINASNEVISRLDFLKSLEHIVFDKDLKNTLLERKQLHRILVDKTWLFGEEFNLSVDDQSLTTVLEKHWHILGRNEEIKSPVNLSDGGRGIVDLTLAFGLLLL